MTDDLKYRMEFLKYHCTKFFVHKPFSKDQKKKRNQAHFDYRVTRSLVSSADIVVDAEQKVKFSFFFFPRCRYFSIVFEGCTQGWPSWTPRHPPSPPWSAETFVPISLLLLLPLQKKHGDEQKLIGSGCAFLCMKRLNDPLSRGMVEKLRKSGEGEFFSKGDKVVVKVETRKRNDPSPVIDGEPSLRHRRAYRPDRVSSENLNNVYHWSMIARYLEPRWQNVCADVAGVKF